jgi:hypothetical protein
MSQRNQYRWRDAAETEFMRRATVTILPASTMRIHAAFPSLLSLAHSGEAPRSPHKTCYHANRESLSQCSASRKRLQQENGDCEIYAGFASTATEFRVVDLAYLEREPPARELMAPQTLRRPASSSPSICRSRFTIGVRSSSMEE